uniref:Uncharacterized protein n=1 Tax=Passalora fulva TaxID=5499 RepID=A0A9Q8LF88_PASFU
MKPTTIISGFEKCGIYPFNPEPILARARQDLAALRSNKRVSTPEPIVNDKQLPTTVRTFGRYTAALIADPLIDESIKQRLEPLFRGAQIAIVEGAEAVAELNNTTVRQNARNARNTQKRQHLQRGGVMKAINVRAAIQEREENTVKQLEAQLARARTGELRHRISKTMSYIKGTYNRPAYPVERRKIMPICLACMDDIANR